MQEDEEGIPDPLRYPAEVKEHRQNANPEQSASWPQEDTGITPCHVLVRVHVLAQRIREAWDSKANSEDRHRRETLKTGTEGK